MQWKGQTLTIAKVAIGGLLIGAGLFLAFHTNNLSTSKGYAVSIAHAQQGSGNQSTYCANWQATKLLAINTTNLVVGTSNTSTRKLFAIGPAEWQVTYKDGVLDPNTKICGGVTLATETWDAPTVPTNCYQNDGTACFATNSYLFGLVAPAGTPGINTNYSTMGFSIVDSTNSGLSYKVGDNHRFVGPGAVGDTNQQDNIGGFYSSGAYGWIAGNFDGDAHNGGNDFTEAAGLMMPLKWNVSGTLYAN
ncbi:MAG TPA: hypothetical protein VLE93_03540 [Candidatus Saccharimonadales bacterium]|nr:hypothetical protein [Candidatus Saccharimonadales bacterium]